MKLISLKNLFLIFFSSFLPGSGSDPSVLSVPTPNVIFSLPYLSPCISYWSSTYTLTLFMFSTFLFFHFLNPINFATCFLESNGCFPYHTSYCFLKFLVVLSLLLSYSPLEMVVNILQPDWEGVGMRLLKLMSWCAVAVHLESHFMPVTVLKGWTSCFPILPAATLSPGQNPWLTISVLQSLAGLQHHTVCILGTHHALTLIQLILMPLAKSANL